MVKKDLVRNIALAITCVLTLALLRLFVFEPYQVTENEANSYLQADEWVVANQLSSIKYGDLILYSHDKHYYVGRVLAQEKDAVTFMDDVFYLNNEVQPEPYLNDTSGAEYYTEDFTLATLTQSDMREIPEASFLVLNDDRKNLKDSRQFGLISRDDIVGVINFRLTPLKDFGFIDNGLPTS